ncbi:MAG: metallophosphoesterase family protein [Gemmatimonadota bacterium]|nr:metallophosphoesterase family protein [Gemmatimonadota bacterium]
MNCQRLIIVGDAHLGRGTREAAAAFVAFLDTVPSLGDGLLITGDLFEFWFSYRRVVPRRGLTVVAALAHLQRRLPILLAGGNHDRWGGTFWRNDLDIEFAPAEGRFTVGDRPGLVVHGDGLVEGHWSGSLLQRITRHPATVALFGSLHPDAGLWLVDRLSGVLGDRARTESEITDGASRQLAWARARMTREPELALLAMGHSHRPALEEVAPGRFYVNPGAWFDGYRYAIVADGIPSLAQFRP